MDKEKCAVAGPYACFKLASPNPTQPPITPSKGWCWACSHCAVYDCIRGFRLSAITQFQEVSKALCIKIYE